KSPKNRPSLATETRASGQKQVASIGFSPLCAAMRLICSTAHQTAPAPRRRAPTVRFRRLGLYANTVATWRRKLLVLQIQLYDQGSHNSPYCPYEFLRTVRWRATDCYRLSQ